MSLEEANAALEATRSERTVAAADAADPTLGAFLDDALKDLLAGEQA
ncbi:MAG: hypothetical protein JOZ27_00385 [Caulobacteraceae bacterium]|nr:hypothetical protein [Caulobacteraceae bacterium]